MLPIWNHPVVAGLFMLVIDWGAVLATRILWERHFYWTRWVSFRVGDVLLGLYGLFAAILIKDHAVTGIQADFWWQVAIFGIGMVFSIAIEQISIPGRDKDITGLPSQLWHTMIFPVMFYLIVWSGLVIVTQSHDKPSVVVLAVLCIAGYIFTLWYDNSPKQDKSPERLVDGIRI